MPPFFQDLHFPKSGIDRSRGVGKQPNRPAANGEYARTTPGGVNVRGFEPGSNRSRGGCRPGLAKYVPARTAAGVWVVQALDLLVGVGYDPPGGGMPQTSQSGRVVTVVAVVKGVVYTASPGDTTWTAATNSAAGTPALNASGILFSAANAQKLWFADGVNWVYYDPHTNVTDDWAATAGTLPQDEDGNRPRLICTYRGRTVLSGIIKDPQNIFFSAVGDPTDFDYAPASITPTQAVALNAAPMGLIGDVVTGLIPYTDDVLVVLCDHSVWMLRGDPASGGRLDLVSDAIGGAWGEAWCKDPYGTIYFVSNRCGIYSLVPGQVPVRVSQPVEQLLADIDTGANSIRLVWNDRYQGLHVFVTPLAAPGAAVHFFLEKRSGAWWTDVFADPNQNPLACVVVDGNGPNDRVPIIGSWDGYVRALTPAATDDDGEAIASEVWIGPLLTKDMDELILDQVQAIVGEGSGTVACTVHCGATAEQALAAAGVSVGSFAAGRSYTFPVRRAGHAIYLRLTSASPWALEQVRVRMQTKGKVGRRSR